MTSLTAGVRPAAAASTTITATADTYVSSAAPSTAFGSATSVRIDGSPILRTYLTFDLRSLTGSVSAARLQVYSETTGSKAVVVSSAPTTWSEATLTYATAPAAIRQLSSVSGNTAGSWLSADVSSGTSLGTTVSFVLTTSALTSQGFASRESANKPRLVVETSGGGTPSPSPSPSPPSPAGDVVLAAAGDIACDPSASAFKGGVGSAESCRQMATSDLIVQRKPTGVAVLGDAQYEDGTLADFQASYHPSWGRFKAITRPAVGNHEYRTDGGTGFFAYFGTAGGDPTKAYYSYDLGAWHVVVLNSTCTQLGGCGAGSAQEKWLRADLAANAGKLCTVAYSHAPRWSGGEHGDNSSMAALYQALYDYKVEVLMSGHDHDYERFAERAPDGSAAAGRGVRQFVVGTGGKNHRTMTPGTHTQAWNADSFGVLFLTMKSSSYSWQFVPAAGDTFTDSGSGTCR